MRTPRALATMCSTQIFIALSTKKPGSLAGLVLLGRLGRGRLFPQHPLQNLVALLVVLLGIVSHGQRPS